MRVIPLLAVLLLAACSGAPPAPPSPSPSPSPSPTEPATTEWHVLADGLSLGQEPFRVAAAFDEDELAALWQQLGQAGAPPAVEFEHEAVLYLGTAGSSSCPEVLERVVVDEGAARVYGVWRTNVSPNGACTDDLAAQGVLLAIDRALLPNQPFLLSLREQPICADCPSHPDQQLVDPTVG